MIAPTAPTLPTEIERLVDVFESTTRVLGMAQARSGQVEPLDEKRHAAARSALRTAILAALRDAREEGAREQRTAKDGAYAERNQVVALLARMALALGWRAGTRDHEPNPDPSWDDDWKNVVAIDLPAGQVTWHYHDSDRPLFAGLPQYDGRWDGHNTAEKYRRVNAALGSAAACGEGSDR